ncbi:MAG: flavin-containing monooxygenase [Solirubrobacteraceae bacterium]
MPEHHDVLIVGAGLSGVGAGCHLQLACPGKSYAILEAREAIGGTWDLFRYPGIRSDSDMFTLGYSFKPWTETKAIADGASIRNYIVQTAAEHGIGDHIRLGHRVVRADWSSPDARWTLTVEQTTTGETIELTCGFVYWCSGYYRYDQGFSPEFPGLARFSGPVVHPQHWPEDLDYTGKGVVVIGSGATAVTLVPSMAERAAHVTMLQRSPSYVVSLPARDRVADFLRRHLSDRAAYAIVRWKNVVRTILSFELSRRRPELMKKLLRRGLQLHLPGGFDIATHFNPRYNPWDQRLCLVPDGDLFRALGDGRASIVTDRIETFTEEGLKLASGAELKADVVITATGLNVTLFGGTPIAIDGRQVSLSERVAYKGMMLSGVPNMALALGYTNASWTLKCDLVSGYVCRLLNHMDAYGYDRCTPIEPGPDQPRTPIIDFKSGYVLRVVDQLPKQGARTPWRLHQNYIKDIRMFRHAQLEDGAVRFERPAGVPAGQRELAAA